MAPWLLQLLVTPKWFIGQFCSVAQRAAWRQLVWGRANLPSKVASVPQFPSPVESFFGLMFKLAAPRIQSEISSVVFKDFHVPTVAFLFAWSLLVPGAWPLPQTPYIFTPLFSDSPSPSAWSLLPVPFEMRSPVQILLLPWSFSLFCWIKDFSLVKSNQSCHCSHSSLFPPL